ncbi:MAG: amidase [Gammaproteobacteria bacterium]|nr:amidase [Gammaproteobacteria bacterium]MBU0788203.1 amidase [Gammaproteobacteria bacterium]MBU0815300.1 amidase [Gammaproteobacteria bacterium]MBU1785592.1 amidase [Gammaproteobacteria bacterium]
MSEVQKDCHELGVTELSAHLSEGRLGLRDYVSAMHGHTEAVEPEVKAFAHYSKDMVNLQVERIEPLKHAGGPLPSLYGVPVAIKDNIDTEDYPTEYGFGGAAGRTPNVDALLVHKLRQAGALIWAKSRTTELAYMHPTITENPRVPGHTPGGSSSGSAAAVASGLVPAAIGTQTNGSVIRPASFCGIYGYKPSRGLIFNGGVLKCSPSLDQVGVFARSVEDLAAVGEVMIGGHSLESGQLVFPMKLRDVCASEPPLQPKFMFTRTPMWERMDAGAQGAFEALKDELKDCLVEVELPPSVINALSWLKAVMEAEMQVNLKHVVDAAGGKASQPTLDMLERGSKILASEYLLARERMLSAASGFDEYFDHFDAIVTPSTLGPAPKGLGSTGDPVMSTIWTFAGLPCISMPLLQTEEGLPLGVQLVGGPRQDARLLRTARWLAQRLG